jgi:lysozyme
MKLNPRLSRPAVELVKRFEPFEPVARPTHDGGWVVGYGHTRTARQGATVTRDDAEALLLYDLSAAADQVGEIVRAPLNGPQFEALTAFVFSIGPDNFRRSGVPDRLEVGAYPQAAEGIERWRSAEPGHDAQEVAAQARRGAAEKAHFLGRVAAPAAAGETSAVLAAVDSLQAKLRELVPDTAAAAAEPARPVAAAPEHHHHIPFPTERLATAFGVAAPIMAAAGLVGVAEPPPPPFAAPPVVEPAAKPHAGPAYDPLSEEGLDAHDEGPLLENAPAVHAPSLARPEPSSQATTESKSSPSLLRYLPHVIGAGGLVLFAGAALAILRGQPSLPSLGLGLVGAVIMAGALYKLMGAKRA